MDTIKNFEKVLDRFSKSYNKFFRDYKTYKNCKFLDPLAATFLSLHDLAFILNNLKPLLEEFHKRQLEFSKAIEEGKEAPEFIDTTKLRFWLFDFSVHSRILMDRLTVLSAFMIFKNPEDKLGKNIPPVFKSFTSQRKAIIKKSNRFKKHLSNFPESYLKLVERASWFEKELKDPRDHFVHLDPRKRPVGIMYKLDDMLDIRLPVINSPTKYIVLKPLLTSLTKFLNAYLDIFEKFKYNSVE